jgi:hypothetical protein
MAKFVLIDIRNDDDEDEAIEALLDALDLRQYEYDRDEEIEKDFHGNHEQETHGNWANGGSGDRDDKDELQKHLVDYKANRELEGSDAKPISKIIQSAKRVGYLDVSGIDAMHRLMGVPKPSLDSDYCV